MSDKTENEIVSQLSISPSPHLSDATFSTRGMMLDVIIALIPLIGVAVWVFGVRALLQLVFAAVGCVVAESVFTIMRRKSPPLNDLSALVTALVLGLSLPVTAPWYVAIIASFAAIGLGKIVFGGLGFNIFNPAMVGRAFVMIAFPAMLGASAYCIPDSAVSAITQATPLTVMKQQSIVTPLMDLLVGTTNGSLGETSAIACLLGGIYLCVRRTASWEIPAGTILSVAVITFLTSLSGETSGWSVLHSISSGALLFGAFFIATDPVTSPLTHLGKFVFGVLFGATVVMIRALSGYPEGVMFAVLLANALTPLINRWTIPKPLGGPVPEAK